MSYSVYNNKKEARPNDFDRAKLLFEKIDEINKNAIANEDMIEYLKHNYAMLSLDKRGVTVDALRDAAEHNKNMMASISAYLNQVKNANLSIDPLEGIK